MLYRYALTEPKKRAVQSVQSGERPEGVGLEPCIGFRADAL